MTTTTFKILLNVNFTIMKHFWVVLIVDKATEKANLPQNLSSPFSFPFLQQPVWQIQFGLRSAIVNCKANLRRVSIHIRRMIYFSCSLDLLALVYQVSVVTYTHMWYDKMIHLLK